MPLLHELLPEYDVRERHEVALPVAPERALEVALGPALIRLRRLKAIAAQARA